jgi:hypothetical protein
VVAEDFGRYPAARVAINATIIHVEIALHVLGQTPRPIRHADSLESCDESSKQAFAPFAVK